ncbi:MAG: ATP-binding protein [Spirochaetales bacterium]|nr:ATP-binding protein [Spirochaetales bacterium]
MTDDFLGESERRLIQQEMFQLEDQKLALEEQYQYLFENALAGLFRIDVRSNRVLTANKELLRTFGVEQMGDLDVLFNRFGIFDELEELKEDNYPSEESLTFSTPLLIGGEERMVRISARYKEEYHVIEGAARDITSLVNAEKRMLEAIREAEQANHAKSLFLANMSHEIRTPLNGIVGFAELIQRSGSRKEARYAENILGESERLMTLINQLLDISKIEANQIELEIGAFRLKPLVRDQVNPFRPVLDEKNLRFRLKMDEELADSYRGDSFRIGQILTNLLSNAVKFTARGEIELMVNLFAREEKQDWLRFSITDTGIGIAPEKQEAVFEKFIQADNSIQRRYGGTGLGVAICKELVELMGGHIVLNSSEGEGTVFTFVIPLEISEKSPVHSSGEDPAGEDLDKLIPGRILLVEDYKINQDVIFLHLEPYNMVVDVAEDGEEAIELFSKNPYDLIIMDVHMPRMSGLEATRRIRKMEGGREIPILGMSASAFSSDRNACREAGMSDFLSKPIRRRSFLDHIYYWLNRRRRETAPAGIPPKNSPAKKELSGGDILKYGEFCEEIGSREDGDMIIQGYLESAEGLMEEIARDLAGGNRERAHRNSHSLKGGALNIMADRLAEKARAMELALKEPEGRDIMPLYHETEDCLGQLSEQFKKMRMP